MRNKVKVNDIFKKSFVVSQQLIKQFADVSSDHNPIHLDNEYAKTTFFKRPIAHGFLIGSFISSVLGNNFPGNGTIYISQTLEFKAPVYAEDIITISVKLVKALERINPSLKQYALIKMELLLFLVLLLYLMRLLV